MIRLEAFIDDKKAGAVLQALNGLVIQMTMLPVRNALVKGKKVVGAGQPETGSAAVREAIGIAARNNQKEITTQGILDHAATYGFGKPVAMAGIGTAKKDKLIKQKRRGIYIINRQLQSKE